MQLQAREHQGLPATPDVRRNVKSPFRKSMALLAP